VLLRSALLFLAAACSDPDGPNDTPAPVIQSLSPATATPGAGPIILTVSGSGFVPTSTIAWNGTARPTSYVSASTLTATIAASDLANPGSFAVTVVTPPPGGGSSAAVQFAVPAPVPTLASLSRVSATISDSTLSLIVHGVGFAPTSVVRWGETNLPTVYAGTSRLNATLGSEQLGVDAVVPITVFTPGPGGGISGALNFTVTPTILELYLPTSDLVYHPASGAVWASVPGTGGDRANTLTAIDPRTGELLASVPIGPEPGKLALSDDGTTLYVALNGTGSVRRFDIASRLPGPTFSLGTGTFGTRYAEDIAVAPGLPHTVAVSMKFEGVSPRHAGLAIFDDGVMRGTPTGEHSGPNVIEFSSASTTLYGFYNETDDGGMYTVTVTPNGPVVANVTSGLILGGADIAFGGGRLYGTTGVAVDPVARTVVVTYPVKDIGIYGSRLVADPANGRIVFTEIGTVNFSSVLHAFEIESGASLRTLELVTTPGPADVTSLIRWGTDGLALRSSTTVFLVRTSLVWR
jgi:hypothetical protein